jgi:hypothetical protein
MSLAAGVMGCSTTGASVAGASVTGAWVAVGVAQPANKIDEITIRDIQVNSFILFMIILLFLFVYLFFQ